MNIDLRDVRDVGDLKRERLVLKVTRDTDLGSFLVLETSEHPEGGVSTDVQRVFWFPDQAVKENDLVVLYTKEGTEKHKENSDGSTSYFYYWGLRRALWHRPDAAAVIVQAQDYSFSVTAKRAEDSEPMEDGESRTRRKRD